jgi:hypothetical protein
MAEAIDVNQGASDIADFKTFIGNFERDADVRLKDSGGTRMVTVTRQLGEKFVINLDPARFCHENFDLALSQALTQIEVLKTEVALSGDKASQAELDIYKERIKKPVNDVFYRTVFQAISAHKVAVKKPIFRQKLVEIGKRAIRALPVESDNIPLHIQFIFGIMGIRENLDPEVLQTLQDLESSGVLGQIFHFQTTEKN